MFAAQGEFDAGSLQQGDIVTDVHLLGALSYNEINFSAPATSQGKIVGWSVPKEPTIGNAMVISHSCEVARENSVKVTSIILAPLRDVSKATSPAKVKELIESNLIDQTGAEASYLKYFYIEPSPLLPYERGAIADFSKVFSVHKSAYEYLLAAKKLQLDETTRDSMALKLALYFHRSQQPTAA